MKIFLFETLFPQIIQGEKLPEHTHRTVQLEPKPSFTEWCEMLKVSSKYNKNKVSYIELSQNN